MNRRQFVAGVGVTFPWFGGCARFEAEERGTRYRLKLFRIDDDEIRRAFTHSAGTLSNEAVNIFLSALDGRAKTYGDTLIRDGMLLEYEGEYYRVTVEKTGQRTRERPVLQAKIVDSEAAKHEAAEWSVYSGADNTAVRHAASNAEGYPDQNDGENRSECDTYVLRNHDPERSDLLPDPEHKYVEFGEYIVRLTVERHQVAETEYTYTTTKVSTSTTALHEFVRNEVIDMWFDHSGIPASQQEIIETAKTGEYTESGSLSEGYRALLERLFGSQRPADSTGNHIGYEDRIYRAQVRVSEP